MKRRDLFGAGAAMAVAAALRAAPAATVAPSWARPGMPGWPGADEWAALNRAVGGRLSPVTLPDFADPAARELLADPFYIGSQAGLIQSTGWLDAWRSVPSAYVVAAKTAADIAAAVDFARIHRVRLVVKGGGHSFFGGSTAPDSLLIWTRPIDGIAVHDAFVPVGSSAPPVPAVSLGAGCIWLHA
jgi:hypothetical protein